MSPRPLTVTLSNANTGNPFGTSPQILRSLRSVARLQGATCLRPLLALEAPPQYAHCAVESFVNSTCRSIMGSSVYSGPQTKTLSDAPHPGVMRFFHLLSPAHLGSRAN